MKYLATIATTVIVIVGGHAVAQKYIITNIHQIKPSVLKQLKAEKGELAFVIEQGPKGEQGKQGVPGNSGVVEVRSAGPIGATGPEGPKGPVGNQGAHGEPGMPFAGAWDEHAQYLGSVVVQFGGAFWLSLKEPNLEHKPVKESEWWGEL